MAFVVIQTARNVRIKPTIAVPTTWLSINKQSYYWPKISAKNIEELIRDKYSVPAPGWPSYPCTILSFHDTYEEADIEVTLTESTSDEEFSDLIKLRKRSEKLNGQKTALGTYLIKYEACMERVRNINYEFKSFYKNLTFILEFSCRPKDINITNSTSTHKNRTTASRTTTTIVYTENRTRDANTETTITTIASTTTSTSNITSAI